MTRGENAELVVELCDRALVNGRLAPGLGWTDTEWSFELRLMLGGSYAFSDRLDRAESLFTEAVRVYETAGWSGGHLALAHAFLGYVYRRRGRLIDAEHSLRESLRLADRVGKGLPMHWEAASMLIDTLLARGHIGEAGAIADRYGFAPPSASTIYVPDAMSVRGRLLLALGRTEEGLNELEATAKELTARGQYNTVLAPWAYDLAAPWPTTTRNGPLTSSPTPACRPSGSARTRRSARPCGARPPWPRAHAPSPSTARRPPTWRRRPARTNTRWPAWSTASRQMPYRNWNAA